MKKRLISFLLAIVMVLGLIPAIAPAANAAGGFIEIGSVDLYAGQYLKQGSSTPTTTKPADNYAYYNGTTLELHNFITDYSLSARNALVIRLFGYNEIRDVMCYNGDGFFDSDHGLYNLVIEGNGTLFINGHGNAAVLKNLHVKSGNLVMSGEGEVFFESGSSNKYPYDVTYPAHAIALCSQREGATWESFDLDKVKDKDYQRVMIISGAFFGSQSPAMPEGKTEHDLGTVAAVNYPISFQGAWTDSFTSAGYTQYESLTVLNSKSQMVYSKSQAYNGEGLTYDLKDLPADRYVINETLTVRDANFKEIFNKTHTFTIDWTPSVVPYVIAKSTEPIAGTLNNTPPTITFDPEFHCKISDYMTGYWMYWDEKAGYKKKMEANTKFQVDEDYYYVVAVETTDGYTFPADGGEVTGIVMCDSATYAVQTDRVAGRDDVVIMTIWYYPCTYGAPLEFSEQTPVADFIGGLYEMEGILGQEYLFRFNHKPLTDAQKAKGFSVERTLTVFEGSLSNVVYNVANDTGTQPLSYNLTIDQAQNYLVSMMITLKKDGTTLQTKGGVYLIRVVAGGTPVIFTADSSNSFGGTVTVDIDAMAKKDANLKTALDNGTVKYQWYRGASQIPGADGQSYTFHADDVGKKIKVAVLYGNSGSISEPFEVGGTAPAFTKQPTGGNVAPGKTMTVKWTTNFTPTKIVVDKYNFVGLASEYTTLSGTATSIELPANEHGYVIKAYYNDTDFITSNKFTVNEVAFVNPFTDVKEGDFFYDPVMWAVENGITTGATATTFNPGGNCLRAHVVTFLHRAEGNPAPSSTKNPFKDVKTSDFFYKPVLWAVEKGITNGTSATTFGSYDNCNRAAVVTFLWRNAGSPEPKSTKNPFVDVKSTDFFYKPVLWAVEQGITNGLDATHFGPATACNRAQVVTFLYRAYN